MNTCNPSWQAMFVQFEIWLNLPVNANGGERNRIQLLLGHASGLTTERYLGSKQNLEEPVNDRFGCQFSRSLGSR